MKYLFFIISFLTIFPVFSQVENLRLKDALENTREVKLSEIASKHSFVQLDYVSDLEKEVNLFCYLLNDKIVCIGRAIYVFNRNGKLLDMVKFPQTEWWLNYRNYCKIALLDEEQRSVIIPKDIFGSKKIDGFLREYFIDDLSTYNVLAPIEKQGREWYIGNLASGELLFKRENFLGKDSIEFYVCSRSNISYKISNPNMFHQEGTTLSLRTGSYKYNSQLYFYEDDDDFIYYIADKEKQKAYKLGCDDLVVNKDIYLKTVKHCIYTGNFKVLDAVLKKYISSLYVTESKNFLMFSFLYRGGKYLGYYSKKDHRTVIAKPSTDNQVAFKDDLLGKSSFKNLRWHVNMNNELCALLSSEDSERVWKSPFTWKSLFPWFFKEKTPGRVVVILQLRI